MGMLNRPQKIALGEMRFSGVRGLLVYCPDYHCSHWTAISGDNWPMTSGFPVWSRDLPARLVAGVALTSGPISAGISTRRNG
jgi:hypothetical protein